MLYLQFITQISASAFFLTCHPDKKGNTLQDPIQGVFSWFLDEAALGLAFGFGFGGSCADVSELAAQDLPIRFFLPSAWQHPDSLHTQGARS